MHFVSQEKGKRDRSYSVRASANARSSPLGFWVGPWTQICVGIGTHRSAFDRGDKAGDEAGREASSRCKSFVHETMR
jgi:hypothetical protein